MALEYFTCIGRFTAVVARSSLEEDPDPFHQAVTGLALFTPTAKISKGGQGPIILRGNGEIEVRSELDECVYVLRPIQARLDNGVIKSIRGDALDTDIPKEDNGELADPRRYGIRLAANTEALGPIPGGLDYTVRFSRVVFDRRERALAPFAFPAPDAADEVVDLSKVVHRNIKVPAAVR